MRFYGKTSANLVNRGPASVWCLACAMTYTSATYSYFFPSPENCAIGYILKVIAKRLFGNSRLNVESGMMIL